MPFGGVASGRVCTCSLCSRLVLNLSRHRKCFVLLELIIKEYLFVLGQTIIIQAVPVQNNVQMENYYLRKNLALRRYTKSTATNS